MANRKILIVDDELDVVRVVSMRLRSAGYDVITASDGMTATKMAVSQAPDLIILDIGMPCGDGHTVAARLQNNVNTMSIPTLFLTARTSPKDRIKAVEAGAVGFLTKPYRPKELLELVSRAIPNEPVLA